MADDLASTIDPRASLIGQPTVRIDGRAKVTGRATYPSDEPVGRPAYAFLVTSRIAKGRIRLFDLEAARSVEGVLDILTHENVGDQATPPRQQSGGHTTTTMQDDRIWHDGQIVAVAVADTYEAAREAAYSVRIDYEREPPSATFGSEGVEDERRGDDEHVDIEIGDFDAAWAGAPVKVDAEYGTPTQHHNPIELFTTTCAWNDGRLTIWEPSQFVYGLRGAVAQQLKMDPAHVHVVSKFVGGAFGSRGGATARTAWIAIAANRIGRPVKLVATRDQGYTIATYRAETRHRVQLGADASGGLQALSHEGREVTSRPSKYSVSGNENTGRLYACANVRTRVHIVHADRNTPGFMRAPPDTPYMFALESALDELAFALKMDPIELRRVNDTTTDYAKKGAPYTSRPLMRCFDAGAERFGWKARDPRPSSMTDGEWRVGFGCATAAYPSNIGAAAARVTLHRDGRAVGQLAAHDIGNGAYTAIAIAAASSLGLRVERVEVQLGDSSLPPTSLAAGSSHTATTVHAVLKACEQLRDRVARAACADEKSPLRGRDPGRLRFVDAALVAARDTHGAGDTRHSHDDTSHAREPLDAAVARLGAGALEAYAEHVPEGMPPESIPKVFGGTPAISHGNTREGSTAFAFGAQFVEVRVHRLTGEVRVPRMLGAFASGTIVNPLTARSQYLGGMIWGLGAALLEETEIDVREARYVNDNISEYHVAVNADVGRVEVMLLPDDDHRVNPLGIKGIGEIGIVGMNAAIANAVFHATGRRIRELPIRMEDLL